MKLSYIQGNASLLVESLIAHLTRKYGEHSPHEVDQELIQQAVDTSTRYAEKLLFGYVNGIIDSISSDNIEQVEDLDPYKKEEEKLEVILARSLMSKKSRWEDKRNFVDNESGVIDYVLGLRVYDPTEERGKYLKYIVNQLRMNNLPLPADGGRLLQALKFFHDNKNTQQWKDLELPVDLMGKKSPISSWRKLEEIYHKLNPEEGEAVDFTSRRQKERGTKGGYKLAAEVEIPNKYKTLYTIYKITEPESAQFLGKGTMWCTTWLNDNVLMLPPEATNYTGKPNPDYNKSRPGSMEPPYTFTYGNWHPKAGETREYEWMQGPKTGEGSGKEGFPYTAQTTYLKYNPLYIIFRKHQEGDLDENGSPVDPTYASRYNKDLPDSGRSGQIFQIGKGQMGLEIKNISDFEQSVISTSLDYVLGKWAESDPDAPVEWIRAMRGKCRHNSYPERPPMV